MDSRVYHGRIGVSADWDVVVVGGGPGGCAAAVAAARAGAKTLLLEGTGAAGGMGTGGLVPAWCPFSDGEKIIYRRDRRNRFQACEGRPSPRRREAAQLGLDRPGGS